MADIRIKDLTTLESASLTGDVFVIDGTTGTRKLSAFSPSFGGNATVTGTLTVNSSSPSVFAGQVRSNLSNASLGDPQIFARNPAASLTNGAVSQAAFFGQPGYTTFVGTTGDGTTASYQGGVLGSAIRFSEGYVITDAANGLLLHGINGSIRLATGNPGSVKATFDSAGTLSLTATTASTSTSSGALVVSGGVGVAGAINAGGPITTGSDGSLVAIYVPGDSAVRAAAGKLYLDTRTTDGGDIVLRPRINAALTLAAATSNATFGGSITTLAPTGGTAAAWKLGTVATVSPTSPNRTIEVDIGGTIYYIHAKTTNN